MINIFHTVPFKAQTIKRDSNGKKVDHLGNPLSPSSEWLKYTKLKNTNDTPILGAIALEDFIGIDIDNSKMFLDATTLLDALPTKPGYVAISMPMEANKGGHILFNYKTTDKAAIDALHKLASAFRRKENNIPIDVQMGNKLIYLATPANTTKKLLTPPIESLEDLTPLPPELIVYFLSLIDISTRNKASAIGTNFIETHYGYMLNEPLTPAIVPQLTPKTDFPDIANMDDIPRGSATEWLLQVRKKLQVDSSVSSEIFTKTIVYLNSLWSAPRGPSKQLHLDIERDIHSPEFKYDDKWRKSGFTFPNYLTQTISIYYDPAKATFIQHNTQTDEVIEFTTQTQTINSILSIHKAKKKYTGEALLKGATPVVTVNTPEEKPRLSYPQEFAMPHFNTYTPSEGTSIIQGNLKPKDYREPVVILDYLEHLIPSKGNRERLMQFLSHKHRTYEPSPLYFVLSGVGGAGKGLFVSTILTYLAGADRVMSEDLHGLTNNFNEHLGYVDYLNIEEAGEGYTERESSMLVAALKRITGNSHLTIEAKGAKKQKLRHYITPFIDSNLQTKLITSTSSDDRRLVLLRSPNKLLTHIQSTEYKHKSLGIHDTSTFIRHLTDELPSFAYYIANMAPISNRDYSDNTNWKDHDYYDYLETTMTYTDRLTEAIEKKDLKAFIDTLVEANVKDEDIDSMFSTSILNKGARALLYWTKQTRLMGVTSLQDICENSNVLESEVKQRYKHMKEKRSYKSGDVAATIQVLEFNNVYTPRVAPVELPEDAQEIKLD